MVQESVVAHRLQSWTEMAAGMRQRHPEYDVDLWESGSDLPADARDVRALLAMDLPVRAPAELAELRYLQSAMTGVEHLPVRELAAAGVQVCNAAGTSAGEIAEFVLARVLEDAKRLPAVTEAQRERRWSQLYGEGLAGSEVLLVGFGAINSAVACLAAAFGATVRVVRRSPSAVPVEGVLEEVAQSRLAEMLPRARYVVCSMPDTPATRGMFDAELLARLSDGALLVNVGRGSLLDEYALQRECASGRIRAAVDVLADEPLPPESPLWSTTGLRISAHCSSVPARALDKVYAVFVDNLDRLRAGLPLTHQVAGPVGSVRNEV